MAGTPSSGRYPRGSTIATLPKLPRNDGATRQERGLCQRIRIATLKQAEGRLQNGESITETQYKVWQDSEDRNKGKATVRIESDITHKLDPDLLMLRILEARREGQAYLLGTPDTLVVNEGEASDQASGLPGEEV